MFVNYYNTNLDNKNNVSKDANAAYPSICIFSILCISDIIKTIRVIKSHSKLNRILHFYFPIHYGEKYLTILL